jgi:hypothetical protein
VVLNHRFVRDFKLYPWDQIEGFLLGEGTASVPEEYSDRKLIPVRLVIYTDRGDSYRAWVKLTVRREEQGRGRELVHEQVQPKTARAEKAMMA